MYRPILSHKIYKYRIGYKELPWCRGYYTTEQRGRGLNATFIGANATFVNNVAKALMSGVYRLGQSPVHWASRLSEPMS